jgi:hypothetical protein
MDHFLIFYAPGFVVIVSIVAAFWIATKDAVVK